VKIDLSRFAGRFRQETRENLVLLDNAVFRLDAARAVRSPEREEILREIMRLAHAMKGAARMLGFLAVNKLCHALEETVLQLRDLEAITSGHVDLIIEARRGIEKLIAESIENLETVADIPDWLGRLIDKLGNPTTNQTAQQVAPTEVAALYQPEPQEAKQQETEKRNLDTWRDSTVRVDIDSIDDLLFYGRELTQALDGLRRSQQQVDQIRFNLETVLESRVNPEHDSGLSRGQADELLRSLTVVSLTLRDRIADVDRSVRLIDSGAVELRMRPIAELFETIPLQVRDLERALGKEIDVEFSGETVRFDGRIVDLLREPLVHIIRNAVDHGMETPAERETLGKDPRGKITIGAWENAGWARLIIADDGRGIDPETVLHRAVELGLASAGEDLAKDSKRAFRFLFDDRFTSRTGATDVSGRGVGLAAVRRRMQELRGDVSVESTPGMGVRFTLMMPTSLSSQHTLVTAINSDGQDAYFAFPTAMISSTSKREQRGGGSNDPEAPVAQGELGPVYSLRDILVGRQTRPYPQEKYLIHCADGLNTASFAVEKIIAESEVVTQPLPLIARSVDIIAGAAALTSEDIVLVINVPALLSSALINKLRR
jgi:two-component system chemotaxis sensor kinase CheA